MVGENLLYVNARWLIAATAGSLLKSAWLAEAETLWLPLELLEEELIEDKQDALPVSLQEQQQAEIDRVSGGEQIRQHCGLSLLSCWMGMDLSSAESLNFVIVMVPVSLHDGCSQWRKVGFCRGC